MHTTSGTYAEESLLVINEVKQYKLVSHHSQNLEQQINVHNSILGLTKDMKEYMEEEMQEIVLTKNTLPE